MTELWIGGEKVSGVVFGFDMARATERPYSDAPCAKPMSISIPIQNLHIPWKMRILLWQGRPAYMRWLCLRAQMRRKGKPGWRSRHG